MRTNSRFQRASPHSKVRKTTPVSDHAGGLDRLLGRLAALSQPALLGLAVFGYFYTVVPVYQKELLSEQIAKKELELDTLQLRIQAQLAQISALKTSIDATIEERERLLSQNQDFQRSLATLTNKQNRLQANAQALTGRNLELSRSINNANLEMEKVGWNLALASLAMISVLHYVGQQDAIGTVAYNPSAETILGYSTPAYLLLSPLLEKIESKNPADESFSAFMTKASFLDLKKRLRVKLEDSRERLSTTELDIVDLQRKARNIVDRARKARGRESTNFEEWPLADRRELKSLLESSLLVEMKRTTDLLESIMR